MSMRDFLHDDPPLSSKPPDLTNEFTFDKFAVSREILKARGGKYLAPAEVVERNISTLNHWLELWGYNMTLNVPTIMKDFGVSLHTRKATKQASTAAAAPHAVARPDLCIIAGSGPSLEDYLPLMRSWPGIIICAATNVAALLAHGVQPHYVLAVDANPELQLHLENISDAPSANTINLLLPITADPETALAWPHGRFWHLDFIQGGADLNNPFNSFQCLLFPYIDFYLTQAGSVTNCAFMLPIVWGKAGLLDIRKVFLFGVECGFPRQYPYGRVRRWKWDNQHAEWDVHEPRSVESVRSSPLVTSANGTPTEAAQLGYKRSLLTIWWAMHYRGDDEHVVDGKPVVFTRDFTAADRKPGMFHLYSCSHGVLEDTLPYVDGKQVLADLGESAPMYDRAFVNAAYKRYIKEIAPLEGQGDMEKDEEEAAEDHV